MSKIYDLPLSYRIVRKLINLALITYYDEIHITGKENIPVEGGFIFAPNHRNALMDALAVVLITPKEKSSTFLARADIFKNKFAAGFLRFAKIMPAFRIRDGYENLSKNNYVFEQCVELLEANQALCIMPEGNQEMPHRVRPLVKGIFRVAFSVQQRNKTTHPLQIVPVGFDYGDPVKFGKHLIINIGKPIDVSVYSNTYSENPAKALNEIKEELKMRLEQLTLHISSEAHYDIILSAINLNETNQSTLEAYQYRKQLSEKLCEIEKSKPKVLEEIAEITSIYKAKLKKYNLQSRNIEQKNSYIKLIIKTLVLTVLFPIVFIGFVLNAFPFFTPVWIRKALKVEFEGFFSSIQFVLGLLLFPTFYLLQSVVICKFAGISIVFVPLLLVVHFIMGKVAFRYYNTLKCTIASIRYQKIPKNEREKLIKLRDKLLNKLCFQK